MKKSKRRFTLKNIISGLFLIFVVLGIIIPLEGLTRNSDSYQWESIDDHWNGQTSSDASSVYEDITISETMFPMQNKGDELYLYRELSDSTIEHPVLCIYSIHCYVKAYLDGQLIYDYGHNSKNEELLPGYGMHVISLPDDYAGKRLEVYYYVQENGAFEGLQAPSIMDSTYRTQNLMSQNRINLIICLFIVIFGAFGMIVSAIFTLQNLNFVRTFWLSLFAVAIGLWSMCNNECMSIFIMNVSQKSYVEYAAFFMFTLPFLLYFQDRVVVKGLALWIKVYYWILVGIQIAFYVGINILHFADVIHFPSFVFVEHIFLVLSILFFVLLMVAERRLYHKTEWSIAIGFGIATLLAFVEMVRYNVCKYVIGFDDNKYSSSLALCVLIIVATLFFDFSSKIMIALRRDTKNQLLQQMAYYDELTGLHNRRYCAELLASLADGEEQEYAIVNMDMNLLKALNDTFGHAVGDKALKMFAEVLQMVYPSNAIITRMGGDEFAVILPDCDRQKTQEYVKVMLEELERRSQQDEIITLSTAYGCAYSFECNHPEAVYKLADQRMYACKKEMHLSRD